MKKILNELKKVTESSNSELVAFVIMSHKLYDDMPDHIRDEIDYDRDSDYENCILYRAEYEKFCDWAISSGFTAGDDWKEIEEKK